MALTKIPSSLLDTSGGFDLQGNITLGDNEKIIFGDDTDLQLYHDGTHSYVRDTGTGNLRLQGTNLYLQNEGGTKNYLGAINSGAVTLYYDNDAKIATSSDGATVTGTLTVTGDLNIQGTTTTLETATLNVEDKNITLNYGSGDTSASANGSGITIQDAVNSTTNATMLWSTIGNSFDFSHTVNVTAQLGVVASGSSSTALELGGNTATNHFAYIDLIGDTTYTDYGLRLIRGNGGENTSSQLVHRGTGNLDIQATDAANLRLRTSNQDRLIISSSGNFNFNSGNLTSVGTISAAATASNSVPIYTFTGDTDTGLGYIAADTLGLIVGGSRKFYVNDTDAYFQNLSGKIYLQDVDITAGALGSTSGDEITHATIGGSRHHLDFKELRTASVSDWNSTTFRLQGRVDTTKMASIDFVTDASYNRHLHFNTASNSTKMVILHGGNVGIGTTDPKQKLTVAGRLNSDDNNDYYGAWLTGNTGTSGDSHVAVGAWYSSAAYLERRQGENYTHLYEYTANHNIVIQAGSGADGRASSSAGNVGIGTTNPTSKFTVMGTNTGYVASNGSAVNGLHIARTSSYGENIYLYTTDGNAIGWSGIGNIGRIESYGNNAFEIGSQQNAPIIIGTNDAEKLRITSTTIQLNGGNQSYSDNQRVLSESENITWPSSTSAQNWTSSNSLPYQIFVEAALHFGYSGNGAISQHFYISLLNNFSGLSIQTIHSASGNSGSSYHTISFTSTGAYNSRKLIVTNTPAGGQNTANLSGTIYYGFAR